MKQLLITGPRQAVFEDVPDPVCPRDGLLVRARLSAISPGTEIRVYRAIPVDEAGRFLHERIPFALPAENGYSMVGDVVEVGPEVSGFKTGDRVFAGTAHQQLVAIPARQAIRLPAEIPDEEAAFLNIAGVGHISLRRGNPAPGSCVAIIGQGVIGLSTLAYCRAFGFRTAVLDLSDDRLAIAKEMGAELAVRADATDAAARVIDHFDGEGADLVIEAASVWPAIRLGMDCARFEGTLVVAARHTTLPAFNPVGHPYLGKKLTLLTTYGYERDGSRWDRSHCLSLTVDLLRRRRLEIEPMLTHSFSWDEIPDIYRRLDEGDPTLVGVVCRW